MRKSKTIERVISISKKYLETSRLKRNDNIMRANRVTVERFVEDLHLNYSGSLDTAWGKLFWRAIPKGLIAGVIRGFDVHPLNISFQADDIANFIVQTTEQQLQAWDVLIPEGLGASVEFAGAETCLNIREITYDQNSILVSGRHRRVASRGVERAGLPQEVVKQITEDYKRENPRKNVPDERFRAKRSRPLLIVHLVEPRETPPDAKRPSELLVALGLSFPNFDDSDIAKRIKYVVNLVEWNTILENEADDFIEEDIDDDAS
jgi:hypothetical protein